MCIPKFWSVISYFLCLHGFLSTLFSIQNNIVFLIEQKIFNDLQTFQTNWVESSTQSSIIIQNSCSIYYPVLCQELLTSFLRHPIWINTRQYPGSSIFCIWSRYFLNLINTSARYCFWYYLVIFKLQVIS